MAVTAVVMGAIALWLESGQSLVWNSESIGALLYLAICGSAVTCYSCHTSAEPSSYVFSKYRP